MTKKRAARVSTLGTYLRGVLDKRGWQAQTLAEKSGVA